MKTISKEKLKVILENHKHWLNKDCGGCEQMRADLNGADLNGADLRYVNLYGADLRLANLYGANLYGADLRDANLYGADLREANLCCANLRDANLRDANLREANLCCANLRGADLREANLCCANLRGANLREANLRDANLRDAKNIPFIPMACPDTGEFICWKKAMAETDHGNYYCIVKLFIPADAKRSSATGRKCRCDKAIVLDIEIIGYAKKEPITILRCFSNYDKTFTYEIHNTVSVDNFDEDRFNECSPGIHFFINKQEAINY